MREIIISELQYKMLIETGAANAAMDLDIYVQQMETDTGNGNENLDDSFFDMISKLKELKNSFQAGKKVQTPIKNEIFIIHDKINKIHELISSQN